MAEVTTRVPLEVSRRGPERETALQAWRPFESLRRGFDRLFDDFDRDVWRSPFRRSMFDVAPSRTSALHWAASPAVDIVEKAKAYEITAELPGMDEKNIEVKLSNGGLIIKGEKEDEKKDETKDYYLHERSFGSFERYFSMPDGVDPNQIEANFKKGVLTVTLPKTAEAIKSEKKIDVRVSA